MVKHTKKERRKTRRFIRLFHWEINSPAFRALTPNEKAVYIELRRRYNGRNNGYISLSAREAGAVCHCKEGVGSRALIRLSQLGFIKVRSNSTFTMKQHKAREYELTALCNKNDGQGKAGSKEFMRLSEADIQAMDKRGSQYERPGKKTKHGVTGDTHSVTGDTPPPKKPKLWVV